MSSARDCVSGRGRYIFKVGAWTGYTEIFMARRGSVRGIIYNNTTFEPLRRAYRAPVEGCVGNLCFTMSGLMRTYTYDMPVVSVVFTRMFRRIPQYSLAGHRSPGTFNVNLHRKKLLALPYSHQASNWNRTKVVGADNTKASVANSHRNSTYRNRKPDMCWYLDGRVYQ